MKELKGRRGGRPDPQALRKAGWRPTAIRSEFRHLIEAIAASRGFSKARVIEQSLLDFATDAETESAGL